MMLMVVLMVETQCIASLRRKQTTRKIKIYRPTNSVLNQKTWRPSCAVINQRSPPMPAKTIFHLGGKKGFMIISSGLWMNITEFQIISSITLLIGGMTGFINNNYRP